MISSFSVCESFGVLYFSLRRTEEEVRPLGIKQNERHAQQQVGVLGRLLQRDREILLQSANAVEHGVAVGIERVAGLFQRVAAGEVMVERFTVLGVLFAVVGGKAAQRDRPSRFFSSSGVRSCATEQTGSP